jgi:uncharacterized protein with von Willebrand factor type A (vWA) domain
MEEVERFPFSESWEGNRQPAELTDENFEYLKDEFFHVKELLPIREKLTDELEDDPMDGINRETLKNVRPILKVLEGNILQKTENLMKDSGGSPRAWSNLEDFSQFDDMDPVESALWLQELTTKVPRTLLRKRKLKGGAIAIIRDISASMSGSRAQWSSMLILGLIRMVRQRRMRVGYIEFNHKCTKYADNNTFFSRAYTRLGETASRCRCSGYTNYQLPLLDAFREFTRIHDNVKHVVFITDGRPTDGDREILREIEQARRDRISVHSIYIGLRDSPEILRTLSEKTKGTHFQVVSDSSGAIRLKTVKRFSR